MREATPWEAGRLPPHPCHPVHIHRAVQTTATVGKQSSPSSQETQIQQSQVETVSHVDELLVQRGLKQKSPGGRGRQVGGRRCNRRASPQPSFPSPPILSCSIFSPGGSSLSPLLSVTAPAPCGPPQNGFILEDHICNPTQIKSQTLFREWFTRNQKCSWPSLSLAPDCPYPLLVLTLPGRTPPTIH